MADEKTDFKEPEHWTVKGLLEHFMSIDRNMKDRSFAFVLGSGASRASGIPTGGELVETWLKELRLRYDPHHANSTLEAWATADNLDINDFDYARKAEFYPQVFERRFRNDPEEGFAFLEAVMADKEPSFGYSVLARILDETRHKVVITTNFDNLVADALSIYTRSYPLVCGHESLAGFVRTHLRRPLVAKIHRDLLFAPINDGHGTNHLADGWKKALTNQFSFHTPIVLGYGGNDGSLMGLLEGMDGGAIPGGIFWCYRLADGIPSERIRRLVNRHPGALIPVVGFDEFLLQLNDVLGFDLLAEAVEQRAQQRAKHYREQVEIIQRRLETPVGDATTQEADSEVKQALAATIERQKDWWAWELKARETTDPAEREKIYRAGLEQFPNSFGLNANFSNFLWKVRKSYDEAERLYRRTLELNPNNASHIGNYASFMYNVRKDYDEAERLYRRALELDPNHVSLTGNFALFMKNIRKNYDEAERLFRRTLELDPNDASCAGNLALFMENVRKNYDEAERLYRRALELDPNHAGYTANLALLMQDIRQNYDEAERLYRRALELDPNDADHIGNFASFHLSQNRITEAKELAIQGWELNANQPDQIAAEIALYLGLIAKFEHLDDTPALGRLKSLLTIGFERGFWTFDPVLTIAKERLDEADYRLYETLATAILDAEKIAELDEFPEWHDIEPIALDSPWDE